MRLTSEDFVQALYRGVLGRDPDHDGLRHHVASLEASGTPAAAVDMLRAFIDSEEFRRGHAPADLLALLQPSPAGAPFLHVASLGSFCYASMVLKAMGLKRYSLPFDWIFSSLAMVAHCIEDEFASFLDPGEYRANPPATRPEPNRGLCDHAFYRREYGVEHVFNHFDPTELAAHAYLVRAVGRFRRLLASSDRKLFIAVVKTQHPAELSADFVRLVQVLEEQTTNLQLMVLAVLPNGGVGDFSHAVLQRRSNHSLSVLQPFSAMDGLVFGDPFDDLFVRRLIAQHCFTLATKI